jgi:hypothetical protein
MDSANQIESDESKVNTIGMACFNTLKLKQIQEANPTVFDVPKSICIPMTIPVHFAIKEAGIYKRMKSMFKQIDAMSNQVVQDSLIGKEVQDSLFKAASTVISSHDQ